MSAQREYEHESFKRGRAQYSEWVKSLDWTYKPTEQELYDLTLHQIWRALVAPKTSQQVRQKYHLAILRWQGQFEADTERKQTFGQLVSLAKKGTNGSPDDSVPGDPDHQDQGPGSDPVSPELGASEGDPGSREG